MLDPELVKKYGFGTAALLETPRLSTRYLRSLSLLKLWHIYVSTLKLEEKGLQRKVLRHLQKVAPTFNECKGVLDDKEFSLSSNNLYLSAQSYIFSKACKLAQNFDELWDVYYWVENKTPRMKRVQARIVKRMFKVAHTFNDWLHLHSRFIPANTPRATKALRKMKALAQSFGDFNQLYSLVGEEEKPAILTQMERRGSFVQWLNLYSWSECPPEVHQVATRCVYKLAKSYEQLRDLLAVTGSLEQRRNILPLMLAKASSFEQVWEVFTHTSKPDKEKVTPRLQKLARATGELMTIMNYEPTPLSLKRWALRELRQKYRRVV